jgi:hypothetical protein
VPALYLRALLNIPPRWLGVVDACPNKKRVGKFCAHGRNRYYCKVCGGRGICVCVTQKDTIVITGGGGGHDQKYRCKEYAGKGICMHGIVEGCKIEHFQLSVRTHTGEKLQK